MDEFKLLPQHDRYDYIPLTERRDYSWPEGKDRKSTRLNSSH